MLSPLLLLLLLCVASKSSASDCPAPLQLLDADDGNQCRPQLLPGRTRGDQLVTVRAPPGCSCDLDLKLIRHVVEETPLSPCEVPESKDQKWTEIMYYNSSFRRNVREVNFSVAYAGWYRPEARSCHCNASATQQCRPDDCGILYGAPWRRRDGLTVHWNLTYSTTVLPGCTASSGCRLQFSMHEQLPVVFSGDTCEPNRTLCRSATQCSLYFPRLIVTFQSARCDSFSKRSRSIVNWPEDSILKFDKLYPGDYCISIKPDVFNCEGNRNSCQELSVHGTIWEDAAESPSVVSETRAVQWYMPVLGVVLALLVSALVLYLIRQGRRRDWLQRNQPTAKPVPAAPEVAVCASSVTVVVFQRRSADEASQLARVRLVEELRQRGFCVRDSQTSDMQCLLRSYGSFADMLALPAFACAKVLLIIGCPPSSEDSRTQRTTQSNDAEKCADPIYEHALCHVRNARLGQDYQRVFVCTLDAVGRSDAEPDLAGLTEGRLFRVAEPSDLACLVEHLRAPASARMHSSGSWDETSSRRLLLTPASVTSEESV